MTKFVGRRGTVGIAFEATRGTPVVPVVWVPFATLTFQDNIQSASENQGFGVVADQDSFYVTLQMAEGDIGAQLYDQSIPYFLGSLLGSKPNTTGANPYTQTFTISQTNTPVSLTLYWTDPDRDYIFPLTVVDSLAIAIKPLGIVEYTIGFKSKTARNWTHQTPVFTTLGAKFLHQHLIFKTAANVGSLTAATAISLKDLNLKISRNTSFDEVMGTVEPEDIISNQLTVEGDFTLNLQDDTYRNFLLGGTYKSMEIGFVNNANSQMDFRFPRVSFTQWNPDYTLDKIATQKVNFKANYDSANAQDIITTATVINTKSSY